MLTIACAAADAHHESKVNAAHIRPLKSPLKSVADVRRPTPIQRFPQHGATMNKVLFATAIGLSMMSGAAFASAELAKAKNCMACHAADKKLVGPSYKDVAAKYASDKDAVAKLSKKIREGGMGVWGQIPMPANPQVSEAEAQTLAKWVLTVK
jgi:cytochrome c